MQNYNEKYNISPYLYALKKFFQEKTSLDATHIINKKQEYHFVVNMVQGQIVHYLNMQICSHYDIQEKSVIQKILICLMDILSIHFFNLFRHKAEHTPDFPIHTATGMIKYTKDKYSEIEIGVFYNSIIKSVYLEKNFNLLQWLIHHLEIKKKILLHQVAQINMKPHNERNFEYVLNQDKKGFSPILFFRYLKKNRIKRLSQILETGEWKIEADYIIKNYNL